MIPVPQRGTRIIQAVTEEVRRQLPPRQLGQVTRLSRRPRGRPRGHQRGRPGPEPLTEQVGDILDVMVEAMSEALCEGRGLVLRGFLALYFREVPPQRRVNVWRKGQQEFITEGNFSLQVRPSKKLQNMLDSEPSDQPPKK